MFYMRGSSSGAGGQDRPRSTDDDIRELIAIEVAVAVRGAIPKVVGSIKTILIELFGEQYAVVTKAAADLATTAVADAGGRGGGSFQYQDFSNMKPAEFDGGEGPDLGDEMVV